LLDFPAVPADRGRYASGCGFPAGLMVGDPQHRGSAGPRLRCEPKAAPRPPAQQLPKHLTHTLLENTNSSGASADEPLGRGMQARRRQDPKGGIFHPGAISHHPDHGHRQHQPVAGYSSRVGPLGMLPLPPNAFEGTEAQFDPDSQTIPTYTARRVNYSLY